MELDVLGVEQEGTEELVGRSVEHDVLDAEWRDVELDELEGCVVEERFTIKLSDHLLPFW